MKAHKNRMTDEQRKIYDFIESNVPPTHRVEATLFMGHLSYIQQSCKKYSRIECLDCPFNFSNEHAGNCSLFGDPENWNIEKMIKNIFSNLN